MAHRGRGTVFEYFRRLGFSYCGLGEAKRTTCEGVLTGSYIGLYIGLGNRWCTTLSLVYYTIVWCTIVVLLFARRISYVRMFVTHVCDACLWVIPSSLHSRNKQQQHPLPVPTSSKPHPYPLSHPHIPSPIPPPTQISISPFNPSFDPSFDPSFQPSFQALCHFDHFVSPPLRHPP